MEDSARGVDLVLDLVGGDATDAALKVVREGVLVISVPSGHKGATAILVEPDGHGMRELAALVEDGRLKVELDRTLPLEDAAEAHRLIEAGGHRGKLVLTVK
jgi:NADPH:quinone reductase-like Zn-dependent oxidoreductase